MVIKFERQFVNLSVRRTASVYLKNDEMFLSSRKDKLEQSRWNDWLQDAIARNKKYFLRMRRVYYGSLLVT